MRSKHSIFDLPVGPPWFRDISVGYLRWLARKGRRPNSLFSYVFELRPFGRWLEQHAIDNAEQLTGRHLEEWQDFRAGEVSPRTQQIAASAVRGALRWAATQEPPLCPPALWLRVTTPRTARLLPRPIPQVDLEKLLNALAPVEPRDLVRLRTRALFLTILSSGARISEALSLDRGQLQGRTATLTQKGGHDKLVVISEAAEAAIADYLEARTDDGRALFGLHRFRRTADTARLGHQGAQRCWTNLCEELGIKRYTSHQLRHSCATELLRQHVDSLVIAKHLGHRGLQSIAGYAEVGLDTRHEMLTVMDARNRGSGPKTPAALAMAADPELTIEELREWAASSGRTVDEEADRYREWLTRNQGEPDELQRIWLTLRWNHDATDSVTQEELETFARLTRHPDLIREAAMTAAEFQAFIVGGGGLWPLGQP